MLRDGEIVALCLEALRKYGAEAQLHMLQEECAEVIQAVNHLLRSKCTEDKLIEEIADVQLMIHQVRLMFGSEKVDEMVEKKARLLDKRLKKEQKYEKKESVLTEVETSTIADVKLKEEEDKKEEENE
jgi:NTP pyrophosphatase (non-canonical NTP hydrolase)